jgi:hypothetical protein
MSFYSSAGRHFDPLGREELLTPLVSLAPRVEIHPEAGYNGPQYDSSRH